MKPADAVTARAELVEELERHSRMPQLLQAFVEGTRNSPLGASPLHRGVDGEQMRQYLIRQTRHAPLYYVSQEMMTLAVAAAESLPDDTVIEVDLPPSREGWMLLEAPLSSIDVRARMVRINAVSWRDTGQGLELIWWTDKYDPLDGTNISLRQRMSAAEYAAVPRWTVMHMAGIRFGRPLPKVLAADCIVPPEIDAEIVVGEDGEPVWRFPAGFTAPSPGPEPAPDRILRALTVIWRLMRQTLASVEVEQPRVRKQVARALQRQQIGASVTVVALRRRESSGGGGSREVEWSHRWLVRGHWRRQRYRDRVEMVYIAPFVKGPDDAPLKVGGTVGALVR